MASEALEDQVAEAKELAYQASLAAAEAKEVAAEALAASAESTGTGSPSEEADAPADGDDAAAPEEGAETAATEEEQHSIAWSYTGDTGPDHWGDLDETFAACESGMEQSPIDLAGRSLDVGLDDIVTNWAPSTVNVVDTGYTIQVVVPPGNTTTIDGVTYELGQFHFHRPAEHSVGTEVFPMELHFVHTDPEGHLAVVAVLVSVGAANPAYDALWAAQPAEVGTTGTEVAGFDLNQLLPADRSSYRYPARSLTTPPCTEGVSWTVLAAPATLSQTQIDAFRYDHNNRPPQELGGPVGAGRQVLSLPAAARPPDRRPPAACSAPAPTTYWPGHPPPCGR